MEMEEFDIKTTLCLTEKRDDYEHCRINVINGSDTVIQKYKDALSNPIDVGCNVSVRFYQDYQTLNEDLKGTKLSDEWFNIFFFNLDDSTNMEHLVEAMDLIEDRMDKEKYCLVASTDEEHNLLCEEYHKVTGKDLQFVEIKYFDNNFATLGERIKEMIISHSKSFLSRWSNTICKLEALTNRKMIS